MYVWQYNTFPPPSSAREKRPTHYNTTLEQRKNGGERDLKLTTDQGLRVIVYGR
jgi:hypothetical protein